MALPVRSIARVALVLLLAVVAGSRLVGAWFWWRQYLEWRASDASGAEAPGTLR